MPTYGPSRPIGYDTKGNPVFPTTPERKGDAIYRSPEWFNRSGGGGVPSSSAPASSVAMTAGGVTVDGTFYPMNPSEIASFVAGKGGTLNPEQQRIINERLSAQREQQLVQKAKESGGRSLSREELVELGRGATQVKKGREEQIVKRNVGESQQSYEGRLASYGRGLQETSPYAAKGYVEMDKQSKKDYYQYIDINEKSMKELTSKQNIPNRGTRMDMTPKTNLVTYSPGTIVTEQIGIGFKNVPTTTYKTVGEDWTFRPSTKEEIAFAQSTKLTKENAFDTRSRQQKIEGELKGRYNQFMSTPIMTTTEQKKFDIFFEKGGARGGKVGEVVAGTVKGFIPTTKGEFITTAALYGAGVGISKFGKPALKVTTSLIGKVPKVGVTASKLVKPVLYTGLGISVATDTAKTISAISSTPGYGSKGELVGETLRGYTAFGLGLKTGNLGTTEVITPKSYLIKIKVEKPKKINGTPLQQTFARGITVFENKPKGINRILPKGMFNRESEFIGKKVITTDYELKDLVLDTFKVRKPLVVDINLSPKVINKANRLRSGADILRITKEGRVKITTPKPKTPRQLGLEYLKRIKNEKPKPFINIVTPELRAKIKAPKIKTPRQLSLEMLNRKPKPFVGDFVSTELRSQANRLRSGASLITINKNLELGIQTKKPRIRNKPRGKPLIELKPIKFIVTKEPEPQPAQKVLSVGAGQQQQLVLEKPKQLPKIIMKTKQKPKEPAYYDAQSSLEATPVRLKQIQIMENPKQFGGALLYSSPLSNLFGLEKSGVMDLGKQQTIQLQKQQASTNQKYNFGLKQQQQPKQMLKSLSAQSSLQKQISKQKFGQRQQQKQQQAQKQMYKQKTIGIFNPPSQEEKSPLDIALGKLKGQSVDILVGMKREKMKILARRLPPYLALRKASQYVEANIEASFKLVPSKKKPILPDIPRFELGKQFRPSKKEPLYLVEKTQYRLNKPGEKSQIKVARRSKKIKRRRIKLL